MSHIINPYRFISPSGGDSGLVLSPVSSSIIALWDFESIDRAADDVGVVPYDLTTVGSVSYATGKIGDSVGSFSTGNYLRTSVNVGAYGNGFTIFGWFKTTSTSASTSCIYSTGRQSAGQLVAPSVENGKFFIRNVTYGMDFGGSWNDGNWHFFTIVVPSGALCADQLCFIDGVAQSGTLVAANGAISTSAGVGFCTIGCYNHSPGTLSFTGIIDQLGVADTEWTLSQHQWVYNSGAGRPTVDVLGIPELDYDFIIDAALSVYSDAGSTEAGDTDAVQEWHDLSGNANNLTQTGGANKPVLDIDGLNGEPMVLFDQGTSDARHMDITSGMDYLTAGPFLMFVVGNRINTGDTGDYWTPLDGNDWEAQPLKWRAGNNAFYIASAGYGYATFSNYLETGNMVVALYGGDTEVTARINGVQIGTRNSGWGTAFGTGGTLATIGGPTGSNFKGGLSQLLFARPSTAPSLAEVKAFERAAARRFGITIAL